LKADLALRVDATTPPALDDLAAKRFSAQLHRSAKPLEVGETYRLPLRSDKPRHFDAPAGHNDLIPGLDLVEETA